MKRLEKQILFLGMIFLMATTNSCGKSLGKTDSPIPPLSSTPLAIHPSQLLAATNTISPAPTHPSTDTLSLTPTVASTITLAPTLPVENADLKLLDLLANNGNCSLPCLWGITPGLSLQREAQNLLNPLSGISASTNFGPGPGAIDPDYLNKDVLVSASIRFLTNQDTDIISYISFLTGVYKETPDPASPGSYYPEPLYDLPIVGEKLAAYMLPHILSDNGRPNSVLLATLAAPYPNSSKGPFEILLLYPEQGILVHYTTVMHISGQNVISCPTNAQVELNLYPSGNGGSFMELINPSWGERLTGFKPIEGVTSMSLDQFYQTFRVPTDQCLETPVNLWPLPDGGGDAS